MITEEAGAVCKGAARLRVWINRQAVLSRVVAIKDDGDLGGGSSMIIAPRVGRNTSGKAEKKFAVRAIVPQDAEHVTERPGVDV